MSSLLIRIYDSVTQSAKAAKQLADEGFENVRHIKAGTGKNASRQNVVAELMRAQIWKGHAEVYADRLTKGAGLVLVYAPFGSALAAEAAMDAHQPVDRGLPTSQVKPDYVWDDAAPLSSVLHIPVLTNVKLPAETLSGVSSLTKGTAFLSDIFGIRLLNSGVHHNETSMGLPLLSKSATPLSTMIGMATLSSNPTPLSSLFGMKALKR